MVIFDGGVRGVLAMSVEDGFERLFRYEGGRSLGMSRHEGRG
jgi:hypothetical protein